MKFQRAPRFCGIVWSLEAAPLTWRQWLMRKTARHDKPLCDWAFTRDDKALKVFLRGIAPARTRVDWTHEHSHLTFWLDAQKNHRNAWRSTLRAGQAAQHCEIEAACGPLPWDIFTQETPMNTMPKTQQEVRGGDLFACLTFAFSDFPVLRERPNIGVNAQCQVMTPGNAIIAGAMAWDGMKADCPWAFRDCSLLPDNPLKVGAVEFLALNYDHNPLCVTAENQSARRVAGVLRVRVAAGQYKFVHDQSFHVAPNSSHAIETFFEPCLRQYRDQKLQLEVEAEGRVIWNAQYNMGQGIALNQVGHVLHLKHLAPERGTRVSENAFLRKRSEILQRLPRFERTPSEVLFCEKLISKKPKLQIDLQKPNVLSKIASALQKLFPDEPDLLTALTYFVHQNMTYSARVTSVVNELCPAEKFRLGAGICSAYTLVLKGLLDSLNFQSDYWNTGHHVLLAVRHKSKIVPLDPTLGIVHFNARGNGLLSLSELASHPEWVERTVLGRNEDYVSSPRQFAWRVPASRLKERE